MEVIQDSEWKDGSKGAADGSLDIIGALCGIELKYFTTPNLLDLAFFQ